MNFLDFHFYSNLGTLAETGRGLEYVNRSKLPKGTQTVSHIRLRDSIRGFAALTKNVALHELPKKVWMSSDSRFVHRPGLGIEVGCAQILVHPVNVGSGPWRLKAFIDSSGHAVTNQFIVVRPKDRERYLEYFWAILNSPLANAYACPHSVKGDILPSIIRKLPMPNATDSQMQYISHLARSYLDLMNQPEIQSPGRDETARSALLHLDAEVLRLYDLSPRLERKLLDLFAGHQRAGVPFSFTRYYPEGYEPWFSLHEYLSPEYQSSTAGALRSRKPSTPPKELLEALRYAVEAFGTEQ